MSKRTNNKTNFLERVQRQTKGSRDIGKNASSKHAEAGPLGTLQARADASRGVQALMQLQSSANSSQSGALSPVETTGSETMQLALNVGATAVGKDAWVRTSGFPYEFADGTGATSTHGWIGVDRYRAYINVDNERVLDSGTLANDYTSAERGHILAGSLGGNGGDPNNIFAQDGGSNRGRYSSFEGQARALIRDPEQTEPDADVDFGMYLYHDSATGVAVRQGDVHDDDIGFLSDDESLAGAMSESSSSDSDS